MAYKRNINSALLADMAILAGIGFIAYRLLKDSPRNEALKFCDQPRTDLSYDIGYYSVIADQIQAAIWYYFDGIVEDDDAIASGLMTAQTDDDVWELICAYGVRGQEGYATGIILPDFSLPESVQQYLDAGLKKDVNKDYADKGIVYRWL